MVWDGPDQGTCSDYCYRKNIQNVFLDLRGQKFYWKELCSWIFKPRRTGRCQNHHYLLRSPCFSSTFKQPLLPYHQLLHWFFTENQSNKTSFCDSFQRRKRCVQIVGRKKCQTWLAWQETQEYSQSCCSCSIEYVDLFRNFGTQSQWIGAWFIQVAAQWKDSWRVLDKWTIEFNMHFDTSGVLFDSWNSKHQGPFRGTTHAKISWQQHNSLCNANSRRAEHILWINRDKKDNSLPEISIQQKKER